MISVGFGAEALSIGVGGIPGILSIKPQLFLVFLMAMLVAMIVPFLLTLIVGKARLDASERGIAPVPAEGGASIPESDGARAELVDDGRATAILDGRVIPLEQVPDEVFSKNVVGDGVAFEPTGTTVVAPADATVSVVMEGTRHACGLTLPNGMELLIHIGVDTVSMGGDGFTAFVNTGDKVRRDDPLIQFDPEKIRKAGHPCTTMLIVTGAGGASDVTMHSAFAGVAMAPASQPSSAKHSGRRNHA